MNLFIGPRCHGIRVGRSRYELPQLATWFGSELWVALTELAIAAGVDLVLTLALILTRKIGNRFQWRRLPQFLITNLPYVVGVILGAVLVKFFPELRQEYVVAATGLAAWLARDWKLRS